MSSEPADPLRADGVITRPSPYSAPETVARLEAEIARRGLTMFARFDHAANARAVGMTMPAATVLVFGSPRAGTPPMLEAPLLALELPLRVLVREDAGGGTFVSYQDPAFLAARYGLSADGIGPLAGVAGLVGAALSEPR